MDEKAKNLLGTATVAVASLGLVSLPGEAAPPDQQAALDGGQARGSLSPGGDLLVELMLRVGGSHSVEALDRELRFMLSDITPERLVQLPALISGLRNLGLDDDAEERVLGTVIDMIADTNLPIDDLQIEQLAAALVAEPERPLLAKPSQPERDQAPGPVGGRGIGLYEG